MLTPHPDELVQIVMHEERIAEERRGNRPRPSYPWMVDDRPTPTPTPATPSQEDAR